jgi:outer membrane protein assembly factor BamB
MEPWNGEQRSLVDQWLAALDDSHWNTRATAARMLGELGELTPLEPLLTALKDEDESVRAATVRALGKLNERAPIDRLVIALSDPSWMVREMAALTLGELDERVPTGPLVDILHAANEDTFVREAAQLALKQAHPEIVSSLAQNTAITPQARDQSPARTDQHHLVKSSQARLIGLAKRFFPLHTAMQEADDLVEISDLATTAHSSLPLQLPVSASSRRSLPLRIAEGALVALLLLGIGLSWLLLAQKLHRSSHAGPTPTASPSVSLSWQGHSLSLTTVNGVVYAGAMDNAVYALRAADGGLLWRYTTAGPVDSPPLVVDGIVYVNANIDRGLGYLTGFVYALRASDGALLWRYTNGSFVYNGYMSLPTVVAGVAYIAAQDGTLSVLRASDGSLLWRYTAKGAGGDSPVVINGIVYVLTTNIDQGPDYLEALRASDGKLLWRFPSYASLPAVVNHVVYVTSRDGLSALRERDGALLWRYALADTGFSLQTILDGVVYVEAAKYPPATTASTHTGGYALQIATSKITAPIDRKIPFKQGGPSSLYALRASDGAVLWHYQAPGDKNNGVGLLAVAGGLVYINTTAGSSKNIFSALRASDGSLLWSYPTGDFAGDVLITNGVAYLTAAGGTVAALRAGDGSLLWRYTTGDPAVNVLVINGVAYLTSTGGTVDALRTTNGALLWHYTIPGQVFNTPLVDGDTVYIGAANGVVYALQANTGVLRWYYLTKISN